MNTNRLTAPDFDEAMDFLNLVFSMSARPHDFARMLPVLYRPTDEHMGCNRVVRANGRIRALVGVFPMTWSVGGATLRVAGIGGVAVHPAERGRGHMKALMTRAVEDIRAEGYPVSWLGGQRQRYQHFGYEIAGTGLQVSLNRRNLKDLPESPSIDFERLDPTDTAAVHAAHGFQDRCPSHTVRNDAGFALRCVSWQHEPWVARTAKGRVLGYLVASPDGHFVAEAGAADDDTRFGLVCAWVQSHGHATVELSPYEPGLVSLFAALADGLTVRPCGNWLITDWPAVVNAMLRSLAAATALPDGHVVIEVAGSGRLALSVKNRAASCEPTKARADLTVPPLTATRLLFGPLRPSLVMPLPARAAILDAWCPLPLAWATQDGV